ncbi:MAG: hypothetical protein ACLQAT_09020, partial [Candidatus Binataceae bacterium]
GDLSLTKGVLYQLSYIGSERYSASPGREISMFSPGTGNLPSLKRRVKTLIAFSETKFRRGPPLSGFFTEMLAENFFCSTPFVAIPIAA